MNENQPSKRRLLENAIEAFQQMPVPDRPSDRIVLDRVGAAQHNVPQHDVTPIDSVPSPVDRKYLVRVVVPSLAAVLVLIVSFGLLFVNGTASTALAEVVKAAEQHKLVRYKQTQTTDTKEIVGATLDSIEYADLTAPRTRSESHVKEVEGETVLITVQDIQKDRWLMTNSNRKTAWLSRAPKGYKSFLGGLQEFQQKKGVTSVKDKLDGRETIKYRLQEDKQSVSLWVDATTRLPVRMEQEFVDPAAEITLNRFVWTDFEWDPELPKEFHGLNELFSSVPPAGYDLDDQTKR